LKKLFFIFVFLIASGISLELSAQTGGRKREHRNQRKSSSKFKRKPSAGNADAFARGGSNRRSSRKKTSSWVYRPTPTSKKQRKEQRFLFKRFKTKGGKFNESFLSRQNNDRSKGRVRGNKVFHKRKF
jgi:hypothetical protein